MAIALVGQVAASAFATTCVATRTTTNGNCLIAQIQHTSRTSVTVTDSAGNTWTLAGTSNTAAATGERLVSVYYCLSAASVTTVTATEARSTGLTMNVSEWSGITGFRAATVAYITAGTTTSPVAASNQDLVIGMMGYFGSGGRVDTLSGGWTRLTDANISSAYGSFAYKLATAAGSQGPTWTGTGSAGLVTSAFYGVVSNVAPTVTPPAAQRKATGQTATLTMTASDPDGIIATAGWANTSRPSGASAPSLTLTGSPTGITATTDAQTVPGIYTFTPSATDDFGALTTGAPATVYWYAADGSCKVRLMEHGSGGWSGTAADLNDGSDSTFAQSPIGPVNAATIARMDPIADGDLKITKLRLRLDPSIASGAAETCKVEILTGPSDTVAATRSGIAVTSTSFVDFAATPILLTSLENATFTDHNIWAIRITANQ